MDKSAISEICRRFCYNNSEGGSSLSINLKNLQVESTSCDDSGELKFNIKIEGLDPIISKEKGKKIVAAILEIYNEIEE